MTATTTRPHPSGLGTIGSYDYYLMPNLGRTNDPTDAGRVDMHGEGVMVAIGSDLIVATVANDRELIGVFDSDCNYLGGIARAGDGVTVRDLLPHAIDTAKMLFPNHLLTPSGGSE